MLALEFEFLGIYISFERLFPILHRAKLHSSHGTMAEWSKAVDLSPWMLFAIATMFAWVQTSTGEIRVGSNPTGTINF